MQTLATSAFSLCEILGCVTLRPFGPFLVYVRTDMLSREPGMLPSCDNLFLVGRQKSHPATLLVGTSKAAIRTGLGNIDRYWTAASASPLAAARQILARDQHIVLDIYKGWSNAEGGHRPTGISHKPEALVCERFALRAPHLPRRKPSSPGCRTRATRRRT